MPKLITRYFETTNAARAVQRELMKVERFSRGIIRLLDSVESVSKALEDAGFPSETRSAYQDRMQAGGAVLIVFAGYKPLAVAKTTRDVTARMGAVDMGSLVDEIEVEEDRVYTSSVLRKNPRFLTRTGYDGDTVHMANWPIPLISRRKPFRGSVLASKHARMANFPIGLISKRKPFTGSIFERHARMANFPLPLLSRRKPGDRFAFPRHARMANFPIGLLSQRKPYTGSIIARHARMANWPFPHLINGKTGTNSLMPGGPRMANFPIPLLRDPKPYDQFLFPRHARMANFPIPLISQRKPYAESMFERHARMADTILPLIMTRTERDRRATRSGYSLPGFFGLPTVLRR